MRCTVPRREGERLQGDGQGRRCRDWRRTRRHDGALAHLLFACFALGAVAARSATAGQSLSDIFQSPRFAHLGLAPLGPALASTVASTYPVASASSSVTFVYNRELDTVERRPGPLGPILGERAETIGKGRFDLALTYSFVDLTTINGELLRLVGDPVPGCTDRHDPGETGPKYPAQIRV